MNNVFKLLGTIAVSNKDANRSIDETGKKASGLSAIFGKVGKSAVSFGKFVGIGMAAVKTASKAATAYLMKTSLGAYAEFEQLEGGVKKLFGDDAAKTVMENASKAFKTAGLSANEYMQTVTSFSASLISSLGNDTAAAAELSNIAIQDMSDNANTFGTDISMIQNAYQGFAKQNYTMLDNLKLGYGGTQAEMARLINDSGVMGENFIATAENVNSVSFAKIIEAIHVVQGNMEIAGTTANEAADTIEGSFNMWKASWQNLMTGLGDDENIDPLVDSFFEAGNTVLQNLAKVLPRIGANLKAALVSAGEHVRTAWVQNIWPSIQNFASAKLDIELPDWATIETAIETGWTTYIKPAVDSVTTWLKDNVDGVKAVLEATAIVLSGMFVVANPLLALIAAVGGAFALLNTDVDPANTTLVNVKTALEDIKKWIDDNKNAVMAALAALGIAFLALNAPLAILIGVVAIVIANWEGLKTIVENVATAINDFFTITLPGWWEDKVVTPIKNAWESVTNAVNTAITAVRRFFGLDGESPFKDTTFWQTYENATKNVSYTTDEPVRQSFATGLDFVPYNEMPARLHYGEAVLTREDASAWRRGKSEEVTVLANRLESAMNRLESIMQQVAANTAAGHTIALDSGVLVGQIAPKMDAQLGTMTARKGRRG